MKKALPPNAAPFRLADEQLRLIGEHVTDFLVVSRYCCDLGHLISPTNRVGIFTQLGDDCCNALVNATFDSHRVRSGDNVFYPFLDDDLG